jgi:hypothetical protein
MRVPTSTEATTALHRQAAFAAKRRLAEARGRIAHKSRFVQRENSHKAETKAAPNSTSQGLHRGTAERSACSRQAVPAARAPGEWLAIAIYAGKIPTRGIFGALKQRAIQTTKKSTPNTPPKTTESTTNAAVAEMYIRTIAVAGQNRLMEAADVTLTER